MEHRIPPTSHEFFALCADPHTHLVFPFSHHRNSVVHVFFPLLLTLSMHLYVCDPKVRLTLYDCRKNQQEDYRDKIHALWVEVFVSEFAPCEK